MNKCCTFDYQHALCCNLIMQNFTFLCSHREKEQFFLNFYRSHSTFHACRQSLIEWNFSLTNTVKHRQTERVDGKFSCMTYDPFAICEWYFGYCMFLWCLMNQSKFEIMKRIVAWCFPSPDHWPLLDLHKWNFLFTQINEAWSETSTSWMSRNHPLVLFIEFLHSCVSIFFLQVVVMMMMVVARREEE